MIDFNTPFPHCDPNQCLQVEAANKFVVIDTPAGKSTIYKGDTSLLQFPYFTVYNPAEKNIYFLAIDECIYFAKDGKKCDFAVHDENIICFVEIKLAAGNANTRRAKKKDAILQLKTSINDFTQKVNLTPLKLEACLCVGYKTAAPRTKASSQGNAKDFIDNFNTELFEGNEMTFA